MSPRESVAHGRAPRVNTDDTLRRASSPERRGRVLDAVDVTLQVSSLERIPGSSPILDYYSPNWQRDLVLSSASAAAPPAALPAILAITTNGAG